MVGTKRVGRCQVGYLWTSSVKAWGGRIHLGFKVSGSWNNQVPGKQCMQMYVNDRWGGAEA